MYLQMAVNTRAPSSWARKTAMVRSVGPMVIAIQVRLLTASAKVMVFFSGETVRFIAAIPSEQATRIRRQGAALTIFELQQWQNGEMLRAWSIKANKFCDFQHRSRAWMFSADSCINGLAHGRGVAVSLDGDFVVIGGRFVLGQMVAGELINIPRAERDHTETTTDG